MYIKRIIIQGFRSYKDVVNVDDFSRHHNVVVGRNGSGKSNFFYAIQLVLAADELGTLQAQQRSSLLHEGTGSKSACASVELVFDNSDNRLPIEKDEVSVRRSVGIKKDQYYLDCKPVTKTDILNLLESAGFSRSNPYYIVKQGQINQLAIAKDKERLELLKEVAGTSVYDERKRESQKLMEEADQKIQKIAEVLECIEERLSKLEREKEELKEYQKWDKQKRSIEYSIHKTELADVKGKLEKVKAARGEAGSKQQSLQSNLAATLEEMVEVEKAIATKDVSLKCMMSECESFEQEMQLKEQQKAQLELKLADLQQDEEVQTNQAQGLQKELQAVERRIEEAEQRLKDVKPRYQAELRREQQVENDLSVAEQRRAELFAKQGRGTQFRTRVERDNWLKSEMANVDNAIRDKQAVIDRTKRELDKDEVDAKKMEAEIAELEKRLSTQKQSSSKDYEELTQLRLGREKLVADRSELWRKDAILQQEVASKREEQSRAEQQLFALAGKSVSAGIHSIRRLMNEFKPNKGGRPSRGGSKSSGEGLSEEVIQGYKGCLVELIDCPKHVRTAVEVTAGGKLFHHVVTDDRVATKLLHEFNQRKMPGEVTFLPLNRLRPKQMEFPEANDDYQSLSALLTYDAVVHPAVDLAFGRTLLCADLDVATKMAKPTGLDCVTLDGDKVEHSGVLAGGFHDLRRSKLDLQTVASEAKRTADVKESEQAENKRAIADVDERLNRLTVSDIQRLETKLGRDEDAKAALHGRCQTLQRRLGDAERSRENRERGLGALLASLEQLKTQKSTYTQEIGTELQSQLSDDETIELEQLAERIQTLQADRKKRVTERISLEGEVSRIESLLQRNLSRRRDELRMKLEDVGQGSDRHVAIKTTSAELAAVKQATTKCERRLEETRHEQATLKEEIAEAATRLDQLKLAERQWMDKLGEDSNALEKQAQKHSSLTRKLVELNKKIADLGTLPAEAGERYSSRSTRHLYKLLEECNKQLQTFGHVNRKALDQYCSFSEYKEKLHARHDEQVKSRDTIRELLTVLDQYKYDAIVRTCRNVTRNFGKTFKRIVPQGSASLTLSRMEKKDAKGGKRGRKHQASDDSETMNLDEDDDDGADTHDANRHIDQLTGVSIRVSFTGDEEDEMRDLNQLSGGQKALVALTLIFAIQQCDPAPFYLFDEVDQALDQQHRAAVADVIHEASRHAQFVTTTFRPEMLEHADKFIGVSVRNKESFVEIVTREKAFDFVQDDAAQN